MYNLGAKKATFSIAFSHLTLMNTVYNGKENKGLCSSSLRNANEWILVFQESGQKAWWKGFINLELRLTSSFVSFPKLQILQTSLHKRYRNETHAEEDPLERRKDSIQLVLC